MSDRQCKTCLAFFPLTRENFRHTTIDDVTYFRHICRPCYYLGNRLKRALQNTSKPEKERVPRLKKTGPKPATLPHAPYFAHVAELPGWLVGI